MYSAAKDWPAVPPVLESRAEVNTAAQNTSQISSQNPSQSSMPIVRLEPLTLVHIPGLSQVALVPELWRWTSVRITSQADLQHYVEAALAEQARGMCLPFATVLRESGQVIGSTRFGNLSPENRRVEIGWTWIAPPWQRSAVNTEAKLLMLRYAFETLGCVRVELKTHHENLKSQAAIERLGAVREGVFRNHMIQPDGSLRHSVYYSILDTEWPKVKAGLVAKLSVPR